MTDIETCEKCGQTFEMDWSVQCCDEDDLLCGICCTCGEV